MNATLAVRPFASVVEYERMIDYFHDADDATLERMGVDRARLPARVDWLAAVLRDHDRPLHEKERSYLVWLSGEAAIGHSSLNRITMGEEAFVHLHVWSSGNRGAGLGTPLFRLSVDRFAQEYALRRMFCEPYAENPGPNRVLPKVGFRFVKRYRTTPGPLNFEQEVNQYVREFPG